jgi:hypothetical protein
LQSFADIAIKYLNELGFEPHICSTESEARDNIEHHIMNKRWPCLFTKSDTTGEKDFEEFYMKSEILDMNKFNGIGIIKNKLSFNNENLDYFTKTIENLKSNNSWGKNKILDLFHYMIPDFGHKETGKFLDSKM